MIRSGCGYPERSWYDSEATYASRTKSHICARGSAWTLGNTRNRPAGIAASLRLTSTLMHLVRLLALFALVAALVSCAVSSPPYHASLRSVEALRRNVGPVSVGEFTTGSATAQSSSLRLSEFRSSVGTDFAAYLRSAVIQELTLAGKHVDGGPVVLHAVLLEQSISASPTPTSTGAIAVKFTVSRSGTAVFSRRYSVTHSWESSLFGGHAIGKAQTQYLFLVQSLIGAATSDSDFLKALRAD